MVSTVLSKPFMVFLPPLELKLDSILISQSELLMLWRVWRGLGHGLIWHTPSVASTLGVHQYKEVSILLLHFRSHNFWLRSIINIMQILKRTLKLQKCGVIWFLDPMVRATWILLLISSCIILKEELWLTGCKQMLHKC